MDYQSLSLLLHYLVCFFLVVFLTSIFGKKYFWLAIVLTFAIGAGKEIRDLFVNPWGMSIADLWQDSLWDFICNQVGIVMAAACLKRIM